MHELNTLREVCDLLGVSRRAVQGYEKVGLVEPSGRNKYDIYYMIAGLWIRLEESNNFSRSDFK